jgi:sugar phosphate isomerase/epimerase
VKLAFSSNAFRRESIHEAIKIVADLGYQGIEVLADVPHAFPPQTDADERAKIKASAAAAGIAIANVNAFMTFGYQDMQHPSWISVDPEDRATRAQHTRDCLRLAADIGAATISTQPGGPLEGRDQMSCWNDYLAGLYACLADADAAGVKLCVEPEPDMLIESIEQVVPLLVTARASGQRSLGLNFDIGHSWCVEEDPAEVIRTYGALIDHIQIEDIKGRKHFHLVPGEGDIDFAAVAQALADVKYAGWVAVELYPFTERPAEVAKLARERLAPIFEAAGW